MRKSVLPMAVHVSARADPSILLFSVPAKDPPLHLQLVMRSSFLPFSSANSDEGLAKCTVLDA
jgi:hypothetical protein